MFCVQHSKYELLNKVPETKNKMIFNTHYDFANNFTLINVANFPNF